MIQFVSALILATAIAAPHAQLMLPPAWQHWHDARAIATNPGPQGLIRLALPSGVYGKANADLGDLRVIDEAGKEIPYSIDQQEGSTRLDWFGVPLSEQGFVKGQYSQAVADLGAGGGLHNELTIETSADEFSAWVEIAASDDGKTWRIVQPKAPIYRFSSDGLQGNLVVHFDSTRDRWLRIRVMVGAQEFSITGCLVSNDVSVAPELAIVTPHLKTASDAPARQTRLTADFGAPNIPASTVRFETSTPEFYRTVDVSVSDDRTTWNDVGQGDIYRDPRAGTSLDVQFPEARGRYWHVTIYNRNDQPLGDIHAALLATPRYVTFRAEPNARYRLIYGYTAAQAPQYDFSRLTTADERLRAPLVALGAEVAALVPPPTVPWTEAHPVVLWLALLIAVGVLAWLAITAMRNVERRA